MIRVLARAPSLVRVDLRKDPAANSNDLGVDGIPRDGDGNAVSRSEQAEQKD